MKAEIGSSMNKRRGPQSLKNGKLSIPPKTKQDLEYNCTTQFIFNK